MINIPFGNSEYQIKTFTENLTPERKYRFCLLQIDQKERALKECQFRRKKIEIDIETAIMNTYSYKFFIQSGAIVRQVQRQMTGFGGYFLQ